MDFLNSEVGFGGNLFNKINKTTNGGINWFYQNSPIYNN